MPKTKKKKKKTHLQVQAAHRETPGIPPIQSSPGYTDEKS